MAITIPGKQTSITATEHAFPEFPDMLFGTTIEGISVFDASDYLQNHSKSASIADFFMQYETPIKALMKAYEIKESDVCMLSKESHFLIDSSLVYLFIAFVQPDFMAYICDRMQELFNNGFCVSDSYLYGKAKQRLSKGVIQAMIDESDQ